MHRWNAANAPTHTRLVAKTANVPPCLATGRNVALLLALATIGCGAPPMANAGAGITAEHRAAMQDSVRTMLADFQRLLNARRVDSLLAYNELNADFRWVETGDRRYKADEIRRGITALASGPRAETDYTDTEFLPIAPGLASVVTQFRTRFLDSTGKETFGFGGAITMNVAHRVNGWRIIGGHASGPLPRGR